MIDGVPLLPGWPGVVLILAILLRDELRAVRLARELEQYKRRVEQTTVTVRRTDDEQQALHGVSRRRRDDDEPPHHRGRLERR